MNDDSATFLMAIRGPVIMIALGVLAALDRFQILPFEKSWPLILIVAGLLNLGQFGRRNPQS